MPRDEKRRTILHQMCLDHDDARKQGCAVACSDGKACGCSLPCPTHSNPEER